ncbi:putative DNA-binding transcriptional regulator AlpA [Halomonas organivorans]|uniref:Putative DNA-binding transcriptional regulator AlpA n=2 Tax=Halomonas organivorans TaxID=257772 RepID=A0A7W5BX04_9GAMM|nr:putative DNA-binding transcriptional regulator AlpA [Halomonas organivorans]
MTSQTNQAWLNANQVADRYGVGVATIWRWSKARTEFPKPKKLGDNCTRWNLADLEAWESSREEVA